MEKGISPRPGQSQCLISLAIVVGPGVGHVTQAESIRSFEIGEGDLTEVDTERMLTLHIDYPQSWLDIRITSWACLETQVPR